MPTLAGDVQAVLADEQRRIRALRVNVIADHGAFDSCADPSKFPAGLLHICTGSYDIPVAYARVDGVYTNKAPGGVAYRCSFRDTEAVYLIERMIDVLAQKLGIDKAEIRHDRGDVGWRVVRGLGHQGMAPFLRERRPSAAANADGQIDETELKYILIQRSAQGRVVVIDNQLLKHVRCGVHRRHRAKYR